jgi:peptidoglycan/LPS O-acetylase OafA/YrhL
MVTQPAGSAPVALRLAAAAQAAEAVGLCVAGVFSAVSTADGKSYELASGVALTVIAFATAVALAAFAVALDRAKPWSRTPVVMTQVFVIIGGFTLLDGHRPEWGWPALALAVAALAGLFTPASLRALNRTPRAPEQAPPGPAKPPAKNRPAKNRAAK